MFVIETLTILVLQTEDIGQYGGVGHSNGGGDQVMEVPSLLSSEVRSDQWCNKCSQTLSRR